MIGLGGPSTLDAPAQPAIFSILLGAIDPPKHGVEIVEATPLTHNPLRIIFKQHSCGRILSPRCQTARPEGFHTSQTRDSPGTLTRVTLTHGEFLGEKIIAHY